MKPRLKEYAKALSLLMTESSFGEKDSILAFINLLDRKGELKNIGEIINLAEKYYLAKKGNKKVVIEMARKMNIENLSHIVLNEGDILEEKINLDLVAGVKISINGEKQIDFSLSKKLNDIFR